jgi:hypothetical protein
VDSLDKKLVRSYLNKQARCCGMYICIPSIEGGMSRRIESKSVWGKSASPYLKND